MEETIKSRIILVLAILTLIFFIGTVSSCSSAYRNKLAQDKEIVKRMDLEEKLNKISQEKAKQEEKCTAARKELEEKKDDLQTAKNALAEERQVNKSLREDLDKTARLKEALEQDLREALIQSKGSVASKP